MRTTSSPPTPWLPESQHWLVLGCRTCAHTQQAQRALKHRPLQPYGLDHHSGATPEAVGREEGGGGGGQATSPDHGGAEEVSEESQVTKESTGSKHLLYCPEVFDMFCHRGESLKTEGNVVPSRNMCHSGETLCLRGQCQTYSSLSPQKHFLPFSH